MSRFANGAKRACFAAPQVHIIARFYDHRSTVSIIPIPRPDALVFPTSAHRSPPLTRLLALSEPLPLHQCEVSNGSQATKILFITFYNFDYRDVDVIAIFYHNFYCTVQTHVMDPVGR